MTEYEKELSFLNDVVLSGELVNYLDFRNEEIRNLALKLCNAQCNLYIVRMDIMELYDRKLPGSWFDVDGLRVFVLEKDKKMFTAEYETAKQILDIDEWMKAHNID